MLKIHLGVVAVGVVALSACGSADDMTTGNNASNGGASATGGSSSSAGGSSNGGGGAVGMSGAGGGNSAGAGGGSGAGGGTSSAGAGGSNGGSGGGGTSNAGGANSAGAGGGANGGAGGTASGGAAGSSGSGGASGDGGVTCAPGVECAGFPTSFVRGCTNDDSCVGEIHQTDCCGARRVMGMNHSEASTFCPAERTACRPQYSTSPGCNSDAVETDTGTAPALDNVATRCADINQGVGTCTTYVCGTSGTQACPSQRHIGTCG